MKNIWTSIVSKPTKYNNNTATLLFLLLFTTSQRDNNIEKTLFVSAGAQRRCKTAGFGGTLRQFAVKFIFT